MHRHGCKCAGKGEMGVCNGECKCSGSSCQAGSASAARRRGVNGLESIVNRKRRSAHADCNGVSSRVTSMQMGSILRALAVRRRQGQEALSITGPAAVGTSMQSSVRTVGGSRWGTAAMDAPGCTWLRDDMLLVGRACGSYCCALHDECYHRQGCTWVSWPGTVLRGLLALMASGRQSPCDECNREALSCVSRCMSGEGIMTPCGDLSTCYTRQCGGRLFCSSMCRRQWGTAPLGVECRVGEMWDWEECRCVPRRSPPNAWCNQERALSPGHCWRFSKSCVEGSCVAPWYVDYYDRGGCSPGECRWKVATWRKCTCGGVPEPQTMCVPCPEPTR